MATDKFPDVLEGPIKKAGPSGIMSFVANGVIAMWAPVIVVAPPTATRLPRVATTTIANDEKVVGIVVGGSGDVAGGNGADAAGDAVDVAVIGGGDIAKVVVTGAATNIVIGDILVTSATAGRADKKAALPAIYSNTNNERYSIGKALFPSTVDGDTIPIILMGGGN